MTINKGERTELRSIVRQQFKVLRAEVVQRQAEMIVGLEDEITSQFAGMDKQWDDMQFEVDQAVLACNRAINDALYRHEFQTKTGSEHVWIPSPRMDKPQRDRLNLRRLAHARVEEQVKAALLRLDREEADLLRTLAIGALESEEAHKFLGSIPTVGELVPASRLVELTGGSAPDDETV